jgi:hypothetical protein
MTEKHIDKARELVEEFSIAAERHVREMQEKQAQFNQQQLDYIAQCEAEDDGNGP